MTWPPAPSLLVAPSLEHIGRVPLQAPEVQRAVAAAISIARALGLQVDDAIVLQNSNKLALRLLPCDALARVAPLANQVAQFEIELAGRL